MTKIQIPHNFSPREYQLPFLREVEAAIDGRSTKRFFYQIWHRRSGKDKTNIAAIAPKRLIREPCLVKYIFPSLVMGRKNLWDGIDGTGFKYIDHIPEEIRFGKPNQTEMKVNIKGGSLFQVSGSDNPDSLRGGNPKLIIISEWAEHDPYTWDVLEPIVRENNGVVVFNTTPKGDNHARAMFEYAKDSPLWHVELLTAKDTGIWTEQQLEEILLDIVKRFEANGRSRAEAEAYFEQEYMCSFNSPVIGSYYGEAITRAEREGRVTSVPANEGLVVHTAWDLGIDDSMSIWFFQIVGQEIHFVDFYESSGEGLAHYIAKCQEKGHIYGRHFAPHDIAIRELGTGKSRLEVAKGLGIKFEVGPNLGIDDGINAARSIFNQCWFDKDKCSRGINALKNYKKEWDEKNKVFRTNPTHDWSSHGADAFRTFAVGYKQKILVPQPTTFGGVQPYIEGVG